MPRNAKRPSEAEPRPSTLLFGWTQQGIENFMATQRALADLVTRKSTDAINNLREGMSDAKYSPAAILTELAVQGTANLAEAQKILLNLVEQETGIVMEGVNEGVRGSANAVSIANRLRHGIDTLVEMQKEFLEIANKHMQARLKEAKAGQGLDTASLVDAAREALDKFLRAQKKLFDVISEEGPKPKGGKADDGGKKKSVVSELAHESASALIDAQKSLLELADQQVNANLQAANHAAEMVNSLKAVFDSITKAGNAHKSAAGAKSD
jgi:hypothetical protein